MDDRRILREIPKNEIANALIAMLEEFSDVDLNDQKRLVVCGAFQALGIPAKEWKDYLSGEKQLSYFADY